MKNTMNMPSEKTHALNAHESVMPLHTHWDSRQLADAVPLRLSQLLDFSDETLRARDRASANAAALHGIQRSASFLPAAPALTLFRTR